MPHALLELVHGPAPETLGVILKHIDDLPDEVRTRFERHDEIDDLMAVREIHRALVKLTKNIMPARHELGWLSSGSAASHIECLGLGFSDAAQALRLPQEQLEFIDRSICDPLVELSRSFLPGWDRVAVRGWLEELELMGQWRLRVVRPPEP
jgi:hypothetical protein